MPVIADAVEFIRGELRRHLGVADDEVVIATARMLGAGTPGARLCLVNVQEDAAPRNLPSARDQAGYARPSAALTLHLLVAFDFGSPADSLIYLGRTVAFFHDNPVFSAAAGVAFPASLETLTAEMTAMNFADLRDLWDTLGADHLPSAVYTVRVAPARAAIAAPPVRGRLGPVTR